MSVRQDLPDSQPAERIELQTTEEQALAIRKAADLVGWTVPQYVLSAALDRAERDLYEQAALEAQATRRAPSSDGTERTAADPFVAVVTALGWPP
ncbi:DUF1778 domain-containing protein [Actinomadura rugatobispora]|uniref:DUF1778 domain-containing protein n=1 Tax=Actinomadura rugatobispora TaxID=1994 RepID=A0ABW1AHN7_9ACTN|nr:hypothetical protein GCM10010200_067930 [Actinomadura rugatobispora]